MSSLTCLEARGWRVGLSDVDLHRPSLLADFLRGNGNHHLILCILVLPDRCVLFFFFFFFFFFLYYMVYIVIHLWYPHYFTTYTFLAPSLFTFCTSSAPIIDNIYFFGPFIIYISYLFCSYY